jgi:nucleotide-binding universal stress UspA family protein
MQTSENTGQLALRNILYTTDFSVAAERALPYAREIARCYGSRLYVVHVLRPGADPLVPTSSLKKTAAEAIVQREGGDLEEQLLGILHEIIFLSGKVWQTLNKFIQEKRMDLVVFSTHGRTGFDKVKVGSVAADIFWNAPCPALIVGPVVSTKPRENATLNRILYATDFGVESLAAAPYAISLAQEHRAQLILLHSIESEGDVPAMFDTLRQLVPFGTELRCEPDRVVEHGAPAGKILEVAVGHGADLIVLGIHGNKGLIQKHLTRSGVFRIVAQAKCPVLIVRA